MGTNENEAGPSLFEGTARAAVVPFHAKKRKGRQSYPRGLINVIKLELIVSEFLRRSRKRTCITSDR